MSDNDLRATGYKSGQNKVLGGGGRDEDNKMNRNYIMSVRSGGNKAG